MKHPKHVESLRTLTVIQMSLPITFGKLSAARKTQMNQRSKAVYSYIADHGGTELARSLEYGMREKVCQSGSCFITGSNLLLVSLRVVEERLS